MYENYFGFADLPFRVTPEPHYFYSNPIYQEALATLRYGIEGRKGFIVITGEVGTGKTTLMKLFMQSVNDNIHIAYIFNPNFSFTELLRFILRDFGVSHTADDKFTLMQQLNGYLIEQLNRDHIVALLLDEAQNLSDGVLEELRLFSNVETDRHKLIQIVLIGQPELEQRLEQAELRQLKQRVAVRCCLDPLRTHEIERYISFRIKKAGYDGEELFDRNAIERIALYSTGIPRLINVICDNALRIAYDLSARKVSDEMIEQVACDLQLPVPRQVPDSMSINNPESQTEPDKTLGRNMEKKPARRPWSIGPRPLRTAIALGLVVLGAALLYSQHNRNRFADLPLITADSTSARSENLKQTTLLPKLDDEGGGFNERNLKNDAVAKTIQSAKTTRVSGDKVQPAEQRRNERRVPMSAETSARRGRFSGGDFKVLGKSPIYVKPQRQSAIVTTLWPGMRVRVESETGSYLRVRSLSHPEITGYVHQQDAQLQRIDDRPRSGRARASQLQEGRSDSFALGPIVKSIIEKLERDFTADYHTVAEKHQYE
jgi:general secretion pathway protein A